MPIGNTFTTQGVLQASTLTSFSSRVTQAVLQLGATLNYSCRATQVVLQCSAWTAYFTRITQAVLQVWVMSCSSTSYVVPATTGLIVTVATSGGSGTFEIDLSWTALPNFTYTVKRSLTSGGTLTTLATGLTGNTYADTGRAANTTYYYKVVGTNPCGDITTSNEASGMFVCTAPTAPVGLSVSWAAGVTTLIWQAVPASTYTVYRIGPGETAFSVLVTGLTSPTYADPLTVEGVYVYAVGAVNLCGTMVGGAGSVTVPCCTQWGNTSTCDTTFVAGPACGPTAYVAGTPCDTAFTAGSACGPTTYTPDTTPTTPWTKTGCN